MRPPQDKRAPLVVGAQPRLPAAGCHAIEGADNGEGAASAWETAMEHRFAKLQEAAEKA